MVLTWLIRCVGAKKCRPIPHIVWQSQTLGDLQAQSARSDTGVSLLTPLKLGKLGAILRWSGYANVVILMLLPL